MEVISEPPDEAAVLRYLRRYTVRWFKGVFKEFTPAQLMSIPAIKEGRNVLISSPTGTGKTLAAFLAILDELYGLAEEGLLEETVYVVYVSPLRALNNDMKKNLIQPIEGIRAAAEDLGINLPKLRVAVRTSDTPQSERQRMVRVPPHILITTPETLSIILVAPKFRERLRGVRWVIVDEIHELAGSKRGVHLSLSLERLEELVGRDIQRIGLSATIAPLEEIAKFLTGYDSSGRLKDCVIIDARFIKPMDIRVVCPRVNIIRAPAEVLNASIYGVLSDVIRRHRTTLVFTNTRSSTERVVYKLKRMFEKEGIVDADDIEAHHSSLSRDVRLEVENKLKEGKLKAVVCVAPNSEIFTDEGVKKVSELRGGERILGVLNHKVMPVRYREPHIINYNSSGLLIRTDLGFEVRATVDHKFLTIDGDGRVRWVRAGELNVGDYVGVVRRVPLRGRRVKLVEVLPDNAYLELTEGFYLKLEAGVRSREGEVSSLTRRYGVSKDYLLEAITQRKPLQWGLLKGLLSMLNIPLNARSVRAVLINGERHRVNGGELTPFIARLLGFWVFNGLWRGRSLTFRSSDREVLRRYGEAIGKELGITPRYREEGRDGCSMEVEHPVIAEVFKSLVNASEGDAKRSFPSIVYRLPRRHREEFVSGCFDGCGYVNVRRGRVISAGFTVQGKELAKGLRTLLLSFGVMASIKRRRTSSRHAVTGRRGGVLYDVAVLGGEYLRRFFKLLTPWRTDVRVVNEVLVRGDSGKDCIPGASSRLKELCLKLNLPTPKLKRLLNSLERLERRRGCGRGSLERLLRTLLREARGVGNDGLVRGLRDLLSLVRGDVFFDRVREVRKVRLRRAYGIIDSESGNYVVNGLISKNSSTSLELGIDIGYIDAVVLLSSPKSATRLIQRVGRSGHSVKDVSKGYMIAVDRDDLVESATLAKLALERRLDVVRIPRKPLDILAQHLVGMSLERKWGIKEAFKVVRRAYSYRGLKYEEFLNVLRYLAGRYGGELRDLNVYSKIWLDELEGVFGRKRSVRMIYYLNSGAIPDEAKVKVFLESGRYVGNLEEEFVEYLSPGDVFVLGGRTYEFLRSEGIKAYVRRVEHQRPTVPSWFSEMLPLTFDSALRVGRLRRWVYELLRRYGVEKAINAVVKEYRLEPHAARYVVEYVWEQATYTNGSIPSDREVLIELWSDRDTRTLNIIFHYLFGRRVNDALSRAYAAVLSDITSANVRVTVTDNGFMLTLPSHVPVNGVIIDELVSRVTSSNLRSLLRSALRRSEVLKRRFRHCAERSFALLKRYKGVETSISRRQINSETLLRIAEKIPNFPILEEAYREVMEDLMDVINAEKVLRWIEKGVVRVRYFKAVGVPSPFSHNIVAHGYSDVVLMEDRRKLLLKLYEAMLSRVRSVVRG